MEERTLLKITKQQKDKMPGHKFYKKCSRPILNI